MNPTHDIFGKPILYAGQLETIDSREYGRRMLSLGLNMSAAGPLEGMGKTAAAKGIVKGVNWLAKRFGATFLAETGKEAMANRFDISKMDWNDVVVSTATSKMNKIGKIGGTIWNVFTDINAADGVQSALLSTKNARNIKVDVVAEGAKMGLQQIMKKTGWGELETDMAPMLIDQFKAGINDYLDQNYPINNPKDGN